MVGRSTRHLSAALLVAVWVATPLLSVAHAALAEHTYCSTHERLEEGSSHSETPARERAAGIYAGQVDPSANLDEACVFGEIFNRQTLAAELAGAFDRATPARHVDSPPASYCAPPIALLYLAPKASPPQLA